MSRTLFKETYREELLKAHQEAPETYAWPIEEFEAVLARMFVAIDKGSMNKDGLAFKRTCKRLGIKHTYRDIEAFLGPQGAPQ